MVGILFVGLIAYQSLPVAPLPRSTSLPSRSPPASRRQRRDYGVIGRPAPGAAVRADPGVSQTTSSSGLGTTTVVVQFDLDRNIDAAANDIQAAINAASGQLPRELAFAADLSQGQPGRLPDPAAVRYLRRPASDRGRRQRRYQAGSADQPDFSGVGQVTIGGEQKPAIRIQLDPAKLVAKNISLEDVRTQLAITTVNTRPRADRR